MTRLRLLYIALMLLIFSLAAFLVFVAAAFGV